MSSVLVMLFVGHVTSAVTTTIATIEVSAKKETIALNYTVAYGEGMTTEDEGEWYDTTLLVLKASIMIMIIVASIFGNLLVIVSVMRVRKLR